VSGANDPYDPKQVAALSPEALDDAVEAARKAFAGAGDLDAADRVLTAEVPAPRAVNPQVPPALSAAIVAALARDPEARPAWASELAAALAPHAGGTSAADVARYVTEHFPVDAARERARAR
jgi:hypothetical protein